MEMPDNTVAAIIDHQQIDAVLTRYASAIDAKDWRLFKTCFTVDGTVDYGPQIGQYEGPDKIVDIVRSFVDGLDATHHLTGNYQIHVDGDTASSVSYLHAQHCLAGAAGGGTYTLGGIYRDALARAEKVGRSSFASLKLSWTSGNDGIFREAANRHRPI